jgi:hypothetical protein
VGTRRGTARRSVRRAVQVQMRMVARVALGLSCCCLVPPASSVSGIGDAVTGVNGSGCAASDANLVLLRNTLCQSMGVFPGFPNCKLGPGGSGGPTPGELTAEGDWPNQAVYMRDLLEAMAAPTACLNTTEAKNTVALLSVVDPAKSPWWSTWVQFQVQYYDMPREPGSRIESPATLGRKCWAFAYLRQVWTDGGLRSRLLAATDAHGLSLSGFAKAWDDATALTMPLCNRVMANCFVNATFSPSRNGTCPDSVMQFVTGFAFEDVGGGRNDSTGAATAIGGARNNIHGPIAYPFPKYSAPNEFAHIFAAVKVAARAMVFVPRLLNKSSSAGAHRCIG